MLKCNIGILGISECRWIGSGKITHNTGCVVCYSGRHDRLHYGGVAIILIKSVSKSLLEWRDINHRINYVRLKASYGCMSVIQCYAPTNNDKDEEKDEFYETLNGIKSRIPKHDVIVIMGDMNAKMQK